MSSQPIEELLPKSDWSIYRLVRMAANRTVELADGQPSMIKNINAEKLTSIALNEIAQGKVVFKDVAADFLLSSEDEKNIIEDEEV